MADVKKLSELFFNSVKHSCNTSTAILFSGGLDSSLIATVAKNFCSPLLVTAGLEGSSDLEAATLVGEKLGLDHVKVVMDEKEIIRVYNKWYRLARGGQLNKIELMVPVFACCQQAAKKGRWNVLLGSGAEELFVGYDRYFDYLQQKKDLKKILEDELLKLPTGDCAATDMVARSFGMTVKYPFLNAQFAQEVQALPMKERIGTRENKKPLLRKIAAEFGVPTLAVERKKVAMQYGSGVHKVLMRAKKAGLLEPELSGEKEEKKK
ncbi:Asparagine synthase [Candidatus Anstonella stagnisolia]|nr:Asparagine synthase [Candidatus Anstonella stagnisolia]